MKIDCDCGKTLMACQVPEPAPGQRHIGLFVTVGGPTQSWQLVCQTCKREIIVVQHVVQNVTDPSNVVSLKGN